ncbi:MAG TPA: ester cyclase [Roseiflexaceae bacterium]|nr:ester cyclase [Roseiflexaceae bacterium]
MTTEQNKALVRRFYQAFETNNQAALNEVLAPDLVAYSHGGPGPQNREAHVQGISLWNTAFHHTHFTIEEQLAEGDRVATRVTLHTVHSGGDFQGLPPTGKPIAMSGISIERIENGKIVERRVNSDMLGMLQQLGLIQPPQSTR